MENFLLSFWTFFWIVSIVFFPTAVSALPTVTNSENKGNVMDYEKLKIKSFKYWDLYLHENQCYLGRTFVQLKNESGVEDFMDIKGEVREEFFQIGQNVKQALP